MLKHCWDIFSLRSVQILRNTKTTYSHKRDQVNALAQLGWKEVIPAGFKFGEGFWMFTVKAMYWEYLKVYWYTDTPLSCDVYLSDSRISIFRNKISRTYDGICSLALAMHAVIHRSLPRPYKKIQPNSDASLSHDISTQDTNTDIRTKYCDIKSPRNMLHSPTIFVQLFFVVSNAPHPSYEVYP